MTEQEYRELMAAVQEQKKEKVRWNTKEQSRK